jgi:hypothetical protein
VAISSVRPLAWVLPCAGIATGLAFGFAARTSLGPVDDAYISLRYAANWAAGHGLVFNLGERVEGYSNFLWVAVHALVIRVGVEPVDAMLWLSWISYFALAALSVRLFARHVLPDAPGWGAALGFAASLSPVIVSWASSGMETCLYAALVLGALLAAVEASPAAPVAASGLLALAALTRFEAVALAPILASVVVASQRSRSAGVRFLLVFVVGFGAYFTIRAVHFGELFPNTFYAKLDYGSLALLRRGASYVGSFVLGAAPLSALALCGVALLRRAPLWARACAGVVAVQILVVAWEGGDHFALFRFFAPSWLPLCALAALPLTRAARLLPPALRGRAVAAAGVTALAVASLGLAMSPIPGPSLRPRDQAAEQRPSQLDRFRIEVQMTEAWSLIGRKLRRAVPADSSLSTIAIGAIGYHSRLTIVDPHGLVFPAIGRQRIALGHGYPGHEKFDVEAVIRKEPDYLLLLNHFSRKPIAADEVAARAWGPYNAAMARHPALAAEYTYHSIRFGPRRWLNVHVRRGAPLPEPP